MNGMVFGELARAVQETGDVGERVQSARQRGTNGTGNDRRLDDLNRQPTRAVGRFESPVRMAGNSGSAQPVGELAGDRTPREDLEGIAEVRNEAVVEGKLNCAVERGGAADINLIPAVGIHARSRSPANLNQSRSVSVLSEGCDIGDARRISRADKTTIHHSAEHRAAACERIVRTQNKSVAGIERRFRSQVNVVVLPRQEGRLPPSACPSTAGLSDCCRSFAGTSTV